MAHFFALPFCRRLMDAKSDGSEEATHSYRVGRAEGTAHPTSMYLKHLGTTLEDTSMRNIRQSGPDKCIGNVAWYRWIHGIWPLPEGIRMLHSRPAQGKSSWNGKTFLEGKNPVARNRHRRVYKNRRLQGYEIAQHYSVGSKWWTWRTKALECF